MRTYYTEICERMAGGRKITVVNQTPELTPEERDGARRAAERQLYDVFCKYVPTRGRGQL